MESYYGVIGEQYDNRDYLIGDGIVIPRAPKGTDSFLLNGATQYNQKEVSQVSCTIHAAMGAYSDLTGFKFQIEERDEIWKEAIERGADPKVGWYIHSAVKLVADWVNENCSDKVSYYRVRLGTFEHSAVMRLGYSVIGGFRGNKLYQTDREDNGIIDNLEIGETTFGHALRWNYSKGDEYDRIVDNYPYRNTNLYLIPSANWKTLVKNRVFFENGYVYLLKK